MNGLIARPQYLDRLIAFRDKQVIKVVTGIRRCGKSTLFDIYEDHLKAQGVDQSRIIRLNLEHMEHQDIQTPTRLYDYVKERLQPKQMNYVLIDEAQNVPEFQKAVDGLFVRKDCDVYITGSNAHMLSGELATLLSGRYVEVRMLPLSFKEYSGAVGGEESAAERFRSYIDGSSFPFTLSLSDRKDVRDYLDGILDSVLLKDVMARSRVGDVATLRSIARFMFDNIGNMTNANKIANYLTSVGRRTSVNTVESYLTALTDSFILYKAERYDVRGKRHLSSGAKYYLADIGLRTNLLGGRNADTGRILENVVYLELLRRGYDVRVGRVGSAEVDFIAMGEEGEEYYQVAWTAEGGPGADGKTTLERELAPLNAIRDHNPKFLLTMDMTPDSSHNGIRKLNALDWLLR